MLQRTVALSDRNLASTKISLDSCHDQGHDKRDTCMYTIYHSAFKLGVYSVNVTNNVVHRSLSQRFVGGIIYSFQL